MIFRLANRMYRQQNNLCSGAALRSDHRRTSQLSRVLHTISRFEEYMRRSGQSNVGSAVIAPAIKKHSTTFSDPINFKEWQLINNHS